MARLFSKTSPPKSARSRSRSRIQPMLECLEDRMTPALFQPLANVIDTGLDIPAAPADHTESVSFIPPQHRLFNHDGYLSGPAAAAPRDVALTFLTEHASGLGLTAADLANFVVTNQYADAATGTTHLYMTQQLHGLDIVNATLNINVAGDGRVINVGSTFLPGLGDPATAPAGSLSPALTAVQAVVAAGARLGLPSAPAPSVIEWQGGRAQAALLKAEGFSLDPVPARLVYVATPDGVALAWDLVLRTPDGGHWYSVKVDSATGGMLAKTDWASHMESYNVFPMPTTTPMQ